MDDLLFLAPRLPYPPDKGDKIRSYRLLLALAERYRVHLGCFIDDPADWGHVERLDRVCAQTFYVPLPRRAMALRAVSALARGRPLAAAVYDDAAMTDWVRQILAQRRPAVVFCYSSAMASYAVGAEGPRRILDFVDVDSEKWRARAARSSGPASWLYGREGRRLLQHDRQAARDSDLCLFVSPGELERFAELARESVGKLRCLSNGVDTDYFSPLERHADPFVESGPVAVFTGALDYWPNVAAVAWFVREILPQARRRHPDLRFAMVGRSPGTEARQLAKLPGVDLVGPVADVRPYLAHATLAVAALPVSPGLPNKVLEALAMGKPLVATPAAVAGLDLVQGRELLVAETAETFAGAVCDILESETLAADLGAAGRRRMMAGFTWSRQFGALPALIEGAA